MDVGGWLRGLGLGQYEEQFRDNKIDADVLPRLSRRLSRSTIAVSAAQCLVRWSLAVPLHQREPTAPKCATEHGVIHQMTSFAVTCTPLTTGHLGRRASGRAFGKIALGILLV